jgi:hypothetical protein
MLAGLAILAPRTWGADYDHTEKSPLYEMRLRVPAAAIAIPALRDRILALNKADARELKSDAQDGKDSDPGFHPYDMETVWRVSFESSAVISLSADTNADTGGAHPNEGFQTLTWDKAANRAVALADLFPANDAKPALAAIAAAAAKNWSATYAKRTGQESGPDADEANQGIGPEPEKLKTWALIHEKGQAQANGIVLLYGAGQVWPHVLGDFRVPVSARVFSRYLSAKWKPVFTSP